MPFTSPGFFLLLLLTVPLYYLRRTERWQHFVLFVSSFAFYYFAGVRDLTILLVSVFANFMLAAQKPSRGRLCAAIVLNLGILAYFKYRNFILGSFGVHLQGMDVIPLGISFYLFQLIAYQVDIYRGIASYESSFGRLLLYVLFFPHHQAGPIMRPGTFLPQFRGIKELDWDKIGSGFRWIFYGLFQKVCADRLGQVVDTLFAHAPGSSADGWMSALGFAGQIYGDFAGYSNMAVGFGLLLGYRLDRNFNQPYLATDPSEFWRRWHITLSAWLRDYLYLPLGGNRRGISRTYVNLMMTMVLGGLWHGASWNFVIWGALHGALLCFFRAIPIARWSRAAGWMLCQLGILFCWVPFRATTLGQTLKIWRAMAGLDVPSGSLHTWFLLTVAVVVFLTLHALENLMLSTPERAARAKHAWTTRLPPVMRGAVAAVVFLVCLFVSPGGTTFIYFRF